MNSDINSFWKILVSGGMTILPLVICSLAVWVVIFERIWKFKNLAVELKDFHFRALNLLIQKDREALKNLCRENSTLPTAVLLTYAIERQTSNDKRISQAWRESVERKRLLVNQDLKRYLWILGTIGSASPFIGLFGTVVGILRSFQDIAKTGTGGFAVVAAGISEALIATALGIFVAVVAVMAYNAFLTKINAMILTIRLQLEETLELLD